MLEITKEKLIYIIRKHFLEILKSLSLKYNLQEIIAF